MANMNSDDDSSYGSDEDDEPAPPTLHPSPQPPPDQLQQQEPPQERAEQPKPQRPTEQLEPEPPPEQPQQPSEQPSCLAAQTPLQSPEQKDGVVVLEGQDASASLYAPARRPPQPRAAMPAAHEAMSPADKPYLLRQKASPADATTLVKFSPRRLHGDTAEDVVVSANLVPPPLRNKKELDAVMADDTESIAVWRAASQMRHAQRPANRTVEGWHLEYKIRGNSSGGKGDIYITQPDGGFATDHGGAIRSMGALHEVLLMRFEARQSGRAPWAPPALGEIIEVEVEKAAWKEGDEPAWYEADVRRGLPDGRFLACVHKPDGEADEEFMEWYGRRDEGVEWRRLPGAPTLAEREAPEIARRAAEKAERKAAEAERRAAEKAEAAERKKAAEANALVPFTRAGPRKEPKELPPGYTAEQKTGSSGRTYTRFHHPELPACYSAAAAWRAYDAAHPDSATDAPKRKERGGGAPPAKQARTAAASAAELPLLLPPPPQPPLPSSKPSLPWASYAKAGPGMAAVAEMLRSFRLDMYADAFDAQGYDDLDYLRVMSASQQTELLDAVGMKPGHRAKFQAILSGELQLS